MFAPCPANPPISQPAYSSQWNERGCGVFATACACGRCRASEGSGRRGEGAENEGGGEGEEGRSSETSPSQHRTLIVRAEHEETKGRESLC
eukprot:758720-Hanusia_phi.AAC.1